MDEKYMESEVCRVQYEGLVKRLDNIEKRDERRADEINVIREAIVKIQAASEMTATTLAKMEKQLEAKKPNEWYELLKICVMAGIAIIGALLGTKLM